MSIANLGTIRVVKARRRTAPQFRPVIILITVIMLVASIISLAGCQAAPEDSGDIRADVSSQLADMTLASVLQWDKEIKQLDSRLDVAEVKLQKLNQVATPAKKWIETQQAKAQKEQWTPQVVNVTSGLDEAKNDQFRLEKLQFWVEMMSDGTKYTGVMRITELATGKTSSYEQFSDDFQGDISRLLQEREALVTARNLARSAGLSVMDQYKSWKLVKIQNGVYTISGEDLKLDKGLAAGTWMYYLKENQLSPTDDAAAKLQKVLTGK